MIGSKLRELREKKGLLLRQVAAILEVDTATLSKMERDVKKIRKEHLVKFSEIYHVEFDYLTAIWLADKILKILISNDVIAAKEALKIAEEKIA